MTNAEYDVKAQSVSLDILDPSSNAAQGTVSHSDSWLSSHFQRAEWCPDHTRTPSLEMIGGAALCLSRRKMDLHL